MAKTKPTVTRLIIPARKATAAHVKRHQLIKVINTHGTQVVDCWAFNAKDIREFMSLEHCRVSLDRVIPIVGDVMVTNTRRPILGILEDTCGAHDTLMAACSQSRYQKLGCKEYHRNCEDNLWEAMVALNLKPSETPSPFNLWQNTPVMPDGSIGQFPAKSKKGDYIIMRAEMDLVICLSACPQDITKINSGAPKNAHVEIF